MAKAKKSTTVTDHSKVKGKYALKSNEVSVPASAILLPANTNELHVSIKKTAKNKGLLTIVMPIKFSKVEGEEIAPGEIGLKLDEGITSDIRSDLSRIRIAFDPVDKTFVEVRVPIKAMKKDQGN